MTKHKHVKRDVGLAAVFGAFALTFFATYPSVATLNQQVTASLSAMTAVQTADYNYNGVADAIESPRYERTK